MGKKATRRTAAKITGYILFAVGIFLTIGAIIVLPLIFTVPFIAMLVIGIVLIRWGNKDVEQQQKQRERLDKGWE